MFKSPDLVQSGRTCPANLVVWSCPVRKLIYPVRSSPTFLSLSTNKIALKLQTLWIAPSDLHTVLTLVHKARAGSQIIRLVMCVTPMHNTSCRNMSCENAKPKSKTKLAPVLSKCKCYF